MRFKNADVKFKAGEKDGLGEGEFLVYPSTFIQKPDAYGDVVKAGAFTDTIKAWKANTSAVLSGYYGHRMDDPDYNVAYATDMGEDEHGWWVRGAFDMDSPKAAQVYRLVKGGRIAQLSFAYDVVDSGEIELEDGVKANELRALNVYEFSFVPVGANQDTSVEAVKSASGALIDGVKSGRVLAQKHIDSLRSAYESLGTVLAAAEATGDNESPDDASKSTSGSSGGKSPASPEEPAGAKGGAGDEATGGGPSVKALAALQAVLLLED